MRILILGATGRTGRHLLEQAVNRGHEVRVLVRDRSRLSITLPSQQVFEGNPSDPLALEQAMKGCEVVLSVLNISRTSDFPWSPLRTPETFLSETLTRILEIAQRLGMNRLLLTTAWGVRETRKDIPGWFRWFIDHSNIGPAYRDHERQEILLSNSGLKWTAVRPVGLTNATRLQATGVSFHNDPKPRLTIGRKTLAAFMLDALEKDLYVREMPVVFAR